MKYGNTHSAGGAPGIGAKRVGPSTVAPVQIRPRVACVLASAGRRKSVRRGRCFCCYNTFTQTRVGAGGESRVAVESHADSRRRATTPAGAGWGIRPRAHPCLCGRMTA